MKLPNVNENGWVLDRVERWFAVQGMLPRPGEPGEENALTPFFEASWREFLDLLPTDRAQSAAELAKLAFFAGAVYSFEGLAQHSKDATELKLDDDEYRSSLEALAMEPLQYLRARGIKLP
jgi:hypothetical protein